MKDQTQDAGRCPLCGGLKVPGLATFTADLGFGVVVVRKVAGNVCDQCGEQWITPSVAKGLEAIVERTRRERHQVEILEWREGT